MVRSVADAERLARRALDEARRHVAVTEAFLFGSYVSGTPHEWSDVDLAIFSPAVDTWDRRTWLDVSYQVAKAAEHVVEPHFFGMKARENARPTNFIGHILKTGKRVA